MKRINFKEYADVIAHVEKLKSAPYKKTGKWNLSQVCRHLSYYHRGSLEGFEKMLPWIIRKTIGTFLKKQYLAEKPLSRGGQTLPASVFEPDEDDSRTADQFIALLKRLENHQGPLHPSGLFGELSNKEWKFLHLKHAAHHLSFLQINEE